MKGYRLTLFLFGPIVWLLVVSVVFLKAGVGMADYVNKEEDKRAR